MPEPTLRYGIKKGHRSARNIGGVLLTGLQAAYLKSGCSINGERKKSRLVSPFLFLKFDFQFRGFPLAHRNLFGGWLIRLVLEMEGMNARFQFQLKR